MHTPLRQRFVASHVACESTRASRASISRRCSRECPSRHSLSLAPHLPRLALFLLGSLVTVEVREVRTPGTPGTPTLPKMVCLTALLLHPIVRFTLIHLDSCLRKFPRYCVSCPQPGHLYRVTRLCRRSCSPSRSVKPIDFPGCKVRVLQTSFSSLP